MDIHRSHLRADGTTWPPVTPDPPPPPGYVDPIPELEAALDESVALEHDEAGSKPGGGPDEAEAPPGPLPHVEAETDRQEGTPTNT